MSEPAKVQKHFITFYSPGTLFPEETTKPIDAWDVATAVEMAHAIVERYGARPWGFRFSTRARGDADLDSSEVAQSPTYHLGGKVETIDEVRARNDPKERILLSNMESNGCDRIVVNDNSWRSTQPLRDGDVVLDVELRKLQSEPAS